MGSLFKEGDKLYVITRRDLAPGRQAVQSIHAARQFVAEHPETEMDWFTNSNFIALLCVENENSLREILDKASSMGIKHSLFQEPDLGNQITAITLEPGSDTARLCRKLSLALV